MPVRLSLAFILVLGTAGLAQNPATSILVDVNGNRHAINPNIYGVAFGDAATLSDLNCPLNRLGGNNTTRYNWQVNGDNRGQDWYFESIGDSSSIAGERGDTFIAISKNAGAQPMITVPIIGWVAKLGGNRSKLASFSVAKYGTQSANDWQWFPDAGNGLLQSTGQNITGNDPNDANVLVDSSFQQQWVQHLVSRWGTAANNGLRYYILDNEESIWHATHRDVHPAGATMAEIRDRIVDYANGIRAADPGAVIVGPEEWGWSGYLLSGFDQQYGSLHGWSSLPDRQYNGGADYLPWLLSQLKQKTGATGVKYLDVFSVHYYPQGGEFSNDTSSTMQLRRNRSTRSLWDPNYVDETWINDKVHLIPRLKSWVNTNYYPGTPVAITEYNWGAESSIGGATAQADIFGIFGREGLDMGARWTTPDASTPTYKAMKMYRNYDGNKSGFGDVSVLAAVANPDNVAAFAAQRSTDGAVTVMVISKYLSGSTPISLNVSGSSASGAAQVWQLTAANTIARSADVSVNSGTLSVTLPPMSVSLFVLPKAAVSVPQAVTSATPVSGAAPLAVSFSAANSTDQGGTISSYVWDFGDGSTASGVSASHTYSSAGTFQCRLTVTDNLGAISATTKTIKVSAPNSSAPTSASSPPPVVGACTVLPADNVWNTPVDQLPISSNSTTYVNTIGSTQAMHADFGSGLYGGGPIGIPFVNVPGTQTKYPATFQYASDSDPGPYAVPLDAPVEGGSQSGGDRHAIAIDTGNCILYELYSAFPQAASWQAGSGAIFNLSSNALRPSTWTSADAAGLPIFLGLVRYDEIVAGEIRHAIRFTVPQTQKAFVWPARHYASSLTGAQYPPMGIRFRLKASFDISTYSPTNQIILRALQKYGMFLADNGSAWYISGAPDSRWDNNDLHNLGRLTGANFEAVDESSLMIDPNSGQARQAADVAPAVSVSPVSGIGSSQQFAITVSDQFGSSAVTYVYLLVNSSLNAANACYIEYNRAANTIRLVNDAGNAWPAPVKVGTGSPMSNSQCTLNPAGASMSASGNNLTINAPLTFTGAFGGAKNVYVTAYNASGLTSGWQSIGTWQVPIAAPPALVSSSPSAGSGATQTFALTVSDPNGAAFVEYAYLLINSSLVGANSCFMEYNRAANTIRLVSNSGLVWPTPVAVGTGAPMSNNQCTLNPAGASISASGNNLTINFPLTFASSYGGSMNIYASVYDRNGSGSGWQTLGTWTAPTPGPPAAVSVSPSSGSGTSRTFAFTVSDASGAQFINYVYFLVNSSINGSNSCFFEYNRAANTIRLVNNSGLLWPAPVMVGTGSAMSNSQCTLNPAGASASASGNSLTINAPLTFAAGYAGIKNVYAAAYDATGLGSGWTILGTWTVPGGAPPSIVSINPASGSTSSQTFALTLSDPNGASLIGYVYLLVDASINGANSCFIEYNRAANTIRLVNDSGLIWPNPVMLGTNTLMSNSQCTLNPLTASSISSGNTLTVNVPLTFLPGYSGTKNVYVAAYDVAGQTIGWQPMGTWIVP